MSQIFDLIKKNAVPVEILRSAAKGALSVPPAEMLEILVYLTGNTVFGRQAEMSLAGWDVTSAASVLSGDSASHEVLNYFWAPENRRPALLSVLVENPRIPMAALLELARSASREVVALMLASPRVRENRPVLQALLGNPRLAPAELQQIHVELGGGEQLSAGTVAPVVADDAEAEAAHELWQREHAEEITAEAGKQFELTIAPEESETVPVVAPSGAGLAAKALAQPVEEEKERLTILQRITKMNAAERVKAAFIGTKEERALLIRDGSRVVQNAVLASPKVSDAEVEGFASAKNVAENVLREIARKRRFLKNYSIVRNLVNNPKCPLDISLTLMKNLLVGELKTLRTNKNVPDTVRQVAAKLYKQKFAPPGERSE
ncbi:MAG TPA: hypothetical protein VKZ53_13745 [Candidatus Angelobacter sp.]|nr:hypothetical protein [Candidatus Angelobacter sp.]